MELGLCKSTFFGKNKKKKKILKTKFEQDFSFSVQELSDTFLRQTGLLFWKNVPNKAP